MPTAKAVAEESRDPRLYKANICHREGCQWREKRAEIESKNKRIEELEAKLARIRLVFQEAMR